MDEEGGHVEAVGGIDEGVYGHGGSREGIEEAEEAAGARAHILSILPSFYGHVLMRQKWT